MQKDKNISEKKSDFEFDKQTAVFSPKEYFRERVSSNTFIVAWGIILNVFPHYAPTQITLFLWGIFANLG